MSKRQHSNYQHLSELNKETILAESMAVESMHSESFYPLKKLSRYSNRHSPRQSNRYSNNSGQQSYYEQYSHHETGKSGRESNGLSEGHLPRSARTDQQSYYDEPSRLSQKPELDSLRRVGNFKKTVHQSKKSYKSKSNRNGGETGSYYSKATPSHKKSRQESQIVDESDYERFLRERYPDMANSKTQSRARDSQSQLESDYYERKQVGERAD